MKRPMDVKVLVTRKLRIFSGITASVCPTESMSIMLVMEHMPCPMSDTVSGSITVPGEVSVSVRQCSTVSDTVSKTVSDAVSDTEPDAEFSLEFDMVSDTVSDRCPTRR